MKSITKAPVPTKRKAARTLMRSLVIPLAFSIGLVTSGAAFAGSDCFAYGNGATAIFRAEGEHLLITDERADGRSAVAQINYGDGLYTYWNPNGQGTTRDVNLDIAEGVRVDVRACTGEYNGYLIYAESCSLYKVGIA
ncbi:hypothetical protein ACWZEH_21100 [Streptomyces sp. QTS137]